MRLIAKDTGRETTLSLIDPASGQEMISDFIGKSGGIGPGGIELSDDDGNYYTSAETLAWWEEVIGDEQELLERAHEMATDGEYNGDDINEALDTATDLENRAIAANAALNHLELRALLKDSGLSQLGLIDEIRRLTSHKVATATISRQVTGQAGANPFLLAYLKLRKQKGAPDA